MMTTTLSSRVFNQDTSKAKRAAKEGPVFITDRGRPAYVLLAIEDYEKITTQQSSIVELLAMSNTDVVDDFVPPRIGGSFSRPANLG